MKYSLNGAESASNEIWVIAETGLKGPELSTFELIAKANELAQAKSSRVATVLCGKNPAKYIDEFQTCGVSKIYIAESQDMEFFHDEVEASAIASLAEEYKPSIILGAATVRGRSLLPRIAVLLGTGLTADCTALEIDNSTGRLLQTRPAFGGNLLATIICDRFPQMSTVRPHVFHKGTEKPSSTPELIRLPVSSIKKPVKKVLSFKKAEGEGSSLTEAKIIVAAGLGCGGSEGIKLAGKLAEVLGGALGASRSAVDSGWIEYSHQIGQTGITVHPEIYITCGISGAIQHLVGMQDSKYIISINKDPEAPVFAVSDVAICGDIHTIIPALIKELA